MTRVAVALCAFALVLCVAGVTAQVGSVFGSADRDSSVNTARSGITATASPELLYWISNAMSLSKVKGTAAECKVVAAAQAASTSHADRALALRAGLNLKCGGEPDDDAVTAVQASLESSDVSELFAGFAGLRVLKKAKKDVTVNYAAIAEAVVSLQDSDSLFSMNSGSSGSALATGYAYNILAASYKSISKNEDLKAKVTAVAASIGSVFAGAAGSQSTSLSFGTVKATNLVLTGALHLAKASSAQTKIKPAQLSAFGAYFLENKASDDAATSAQIVASFSSLADNIISEPIAITLSTASFDAAASGADGQLVVSISNIVGAAVDVKDVKLVSATGRGARKPVLSNKPLEAQSGSTTSFALDFMAASPAANIYDLVLSVNAEGQSFGRVRRVAKVTSQVSYGDASITVTTPGGGNPPRRATAKFPKPASTVLAASGDEVLTVSFKLSSTSGGSMEPHQVFVSLTNANTGVATYFVASSGASNTFKLSLNLGDRSSLHEAAEPGTYAVALIVGSSVITNPVSWSLGSVKLEPAAAPPAADPPLYTTPLLHESDTTLKALPDIEHVFRTPDSRPPVVVSRAFTLVIALSFVFLLVSLLRTGANISGIPGGMGFIWAVGFHCSLGAILYLFVQYWFSLTFFTLIKIVAGPCVAAIFFGNRVLISLSSPSVPHDKIKAE